MHLRYVIIYVCQQRVQFCTFVSLCVCPPVCSWFVLNNLNHHQLMFGCTCIQGRESARLSFSEFCFWRKYATPAGICQEILDSAPFIAVSNVQS